MSEFDASPAPATDHAAVQLVATIGSLVPAEISKVFLGFGAASFYSTTAAGRVIQDASLLSPGSREHEHLRVTMYDSTGLLMTSDLKAAGGLRRPRATVDYGPYRARLSLTWPLRTFWMPFGIENMVRAPVDLPNDGAHLASYRDGREFSEADVRVLDRLRPVATRLLRRSALSALAAAAASTWGLSPREAEVFSGAGVGLSIDAIAVLLGLSPGTIRTHLGKAYAKAGVRSRAAATSALLDVAPGDLREAGDRLMPGNAGALTPRETEVLRLAADGRTTSAIATSAGISTETAKTHLANAYRKLGVQNRSQALRLAGGTPRSLP